jgi:spore maturation protein CgeB
MKLVVFGLTISSSWGNGHATLWRGLARALVRAGHRFVFFERDVPYYARHRDLTEVPGGRLHLYSRWEDVRRTAARELDDADAALVTSYCPDGRAASDLVLSSPARARAFYDMDTPVTIERAVAGEPVEYVPARGLGDFDVVLSFTGGDALDALRRVLGARRAIPLYGCVDPEVHHPVSAAAPFRGDLSYLGTWAANRQRALERLFVEPARRLPDRRFVLAGSQYGADFPWQPNVFYVNHLAPADHAPFLCSSPLTLNVTRAPMAAMGYCPSGRLFEAAACGVPCLSDGWAGLDAFFEPGSEILVARTPEDVVGAVELPRAELAAMGRAARERVLAEHTADSRAEELVEILDLVSRSRAFPAEPDGVHGA